MTNHEKLERLLGSIDSVSSYPDGSITIHWKANVGHDIPGHLVNMCQQSLVNSAHQIHLNPDLVVPVLSVGYNNLQQKLDDGIALARKKFEELQNQHSHGCPL